MVRVVVVNLVDRCYYWDAGPVRKPTLIEFDGSATVERSVFLKGLAVTPKFEYPRGREPSGLSIISITNTSRTSS